jgi:hypothetical protein
MLPLPGHEEGVQVDASCAGVCFQFRDIVLPCGGVRSVWDGVLPGRGIRGQAVYAEECEMLR